MHGQALPTLLRPVCKKEPLLMPVAYLLATHVRALLWAGKCIAFKLTELGLGLGPLQRASEASGSGMSLQCACIGGQDLWKAIATCHLVSL